MRKRNFSRLNKKAQEIWETNAAFWDKRMGDTGNEWHKMLVEPATLRLLNLRRGARVLDIACGNGQLARRMTQLGAQVVAVDFCTQFIKIAKSRKYGKLIDYRIIDATDESQLGSLEKHGFHAAVCTMALMDMANIEPLLTILPSLLRTDGCFVFSVMHPCFNAIGMNHLVEFEETDNGEISKKLSIKVTEYSTPTAKKGLGIIGQPVTQYYFHRPLNVIFNSCFDAGFVLDRLEEPAFPEPLDREKAWSWSQCNRIPPVLVARMLVKRGCSF
jgi:2-polyprenyl-3-methyl-5-hydroxy-6-metoxy-1,4-benzoquinol methylase